MGRFIISMFLLLGVFLMSPYNIRVASAQDVDVQTQQLVGKVVSVNEGELSFDLEYAFEDATGEIKVSTFYVTDITTIDIAMTQGTLGDLKPGLNVLVEYALMPDGVRVVESVWVKSS